MLGGNELKWVNKNLTKPEQLDAKKNRKYLRSLNNEE